MAEQTKALSQQAQQIIREAIQVRGYSYADAVRWAEAEAEQATNPYREAATEIRRWQKDCDAA